MHALAREATAESRVYFTGGASAVILAWRPTTIDVDLLMVPEHDALFRAIARLKDVLHINVELVSPADFIPTLPGWENRSPFIGREGQLFFYHYDFYAQALSKVERGHMQDVADVRKMVEQGLVDPRRAREYYLAIEPLLFRYPALNPPSFRAAVELAFGSLEQS
jgi:hypothetical protein